MNEATPQLGGVGRAVDRHGLFSFFVLAFALSWAFWVGVAASGLGESLGVVAVIPGAFGPPVAALVVVWVRGDSVRGWFRSVAGIRASVRWYALAFALPLAVVATGTLVLVATDVPLVPGELPFRVVAFLPTILFMALLGGGQEELGWRGFALPALERRTTPWLAALALGVVWAAWHLPLFYLPGASQYGGPFATYTVGVVGLSVVFTWLFNRSGSVAVAVTLHGCYNASLVLYPVPVDRLTDGGLALAVGAVGVWVVALALLVVTRGDLGYETADGVDGVE